MQKDFLPENSRHERRGKALPSGWRILLERILFLYPLSFLFPWRHGWPPRFKDRVNASNE
ncbi:MAG TPA: hypothetical protein DD422_05550 [Akkermansia sp.]|nr:hypothetical protein [Akkermansia sp.]